MMLAMSIATNIEGLSMSEGGSKFNHAKMSHTMCALRAIAVTAVQQSPATRVEVCAGSSMA
jgi:hypothetical protein